MMIKCPKCDAKIDAPQINVSSNVAYCQGCSEGFLLSELIDDDFKISLDSIPDGAWYYESHNSKVIGATTRSLGAFILIPFTAIWAGGSLSSIYGSQLTSGNLDLFQSLIGIPFFLGSIYLISLSLMLVIGKIEVEISDKVRIFVGIGTFGWNRSFDRSEFKKVYTESLKGSNLPFSNSENIIIEADKKYKLMPSLSEDRHKFVFGVLRHALNRKPTQNT